MSDVKVAIPALVEGNYPDWAWRIQDLLATKKLAKWLSVAPAADDEEQIASSAQALAYVRLHLSPRWLRKAAVFSTCVAAWDALRTEHLAGLAPLVMNRVMDGLAHPELRMC